jgi:sugar O-acyltransferase (sialic acid O-acetyltransferase NeuD family)
MRAKSLRIVGVSAGIAWDVVETANRVGLEVVCVDNVGGGDPELPNLVDESTITDRSGEFVVGVGSVEARRATVVATHEAGWSNPSALVDPTSTVAQTASIAHGVFVNAAVVIGARASVGCFSVINRASSIGHHTKVGAFAHVGPGATLAGEITIGAGAFIGAGAVVLPRLTVGAGAIVGAGAVVTKDVPPFSVVVGSPARELKTVEEWETTCPYCATN